MWIGVKEFKEQLGDISWHFVKNITEIIIWNIEMLTLLSGQGLKYNVIRLQRG